MDIKLSYNECPYHCTNGKVMDYKLVKLIPCPYCSEKRKQLADEGVAETELGDLESLPKILGIDNQYLRAKFVYDAVIPEGEKIFLDEESLNRQKDILDDIYLGLTVGQLPDKSYCIGIGNKGKIDRLAYPLLAKAYLSGLKVAKFISCGEYNRLCINMSIELERYYNSDLVLMLIPDGSSKADIASAKGLMQTRALNGKCTIFITTWVIEACSILLGYFGDETYFLATGVFVEYKVSKNGKKHSKYINQLTGVENETYNNNEDEVRSTGNSGSGENRTGIKYVTMNDLLR